MAWGNNWKIWPQINVTINLKNGCKYYVRLCWLEVLWMLSSYISIVLDIKPVSEFSLGWVTQSQSCEVIVSGAICITIQGTWQNLFWLMKKASQFHWMAHRGDGVSKDESKKGAYLKLSDSNPQPWLYTWSNPPCTLFKPAHMAST